MEELNAATWSPDPGIRIPRMRLKNQTLPSELVAIESVRITQNSVTVHVRVHSLDIVANQVLVSLYEQYSVARDEVPSLEVRLALAQKRAPRTEIHQWLQMHGRWVLKEAKIVLLD